MRPHPLRPKSRLGQKLERWSRAVTAWTGSSWAFGAAASVIIVWLATGPIFHFSDTWQLVINTGTTVVTFLMVFLIQNTQNRDTEALHLKLDELIHATKGARDSAMELEDKSEDQLDAVKAELLKKRDRQTTHKQPAPFVLR